MKCDQDFRRRRRMKDRDQDQGRWKDMPHDPTIFPRPPTPGKGFPRTPFILRGIAGEKAAADRRIGLRWSPPGMNVAP